MPTQLYAKEEKAPANKDLPLGETMDYDACARLAIRQSPFLIKTNLEIRVRRLDEADSKSDFFPGMNFRTRYYVNSPTQSGINPSKYSLEFISDPYNPVEAYFSLQARKLLTKIAIMHHLKVISEGLHRLARMFLEMDTMNQITKLQQEMVEIASKNLLYGQQRQKSHEASGLEVQVAAQEVHLAKLEHQRLVEAQKKMREGIKAYMAWPSHQELNLQLSPTRQQVLGTMEEDAGGMEEIVAGSLDLKIQAIKKELQQYNILLAKTKLLPSLFMGVQTPDPLTLVESRNLFFSVGLNIPIWDEVKRWRNVTRQKTILQQVDAETGEKEIDLKEKWREGRERLEVATADLQMSRAQLELAVLKERQQEIRYRSLGEPFPIFTEGKKGVLQAKKNILLKTLEVDQARLGLRHLAGKLVSRYVDEPTLAQISAEKH